MSIYQENISSNQRGEPSILSLTVSDFLKDVCSKCDGDTEKTIDNFIERLIQLLFKFVELLPLYKVQLNRILRILVDYGVQFRSNLFFNKSDFNKGDVNRHETCLNSDNHKSVYSLLYSLDKKINDIQEIKMKIFDDLLKKESTDLNIKIEVVDSSNERETSFQENAVVEAFHPVTVKKLAELVNDHKISENANFSVSSSHILKKSPVIDEQAILNDGAEKKTVVTVISSNDDKIKESISSKHSITMQTLSSPIMCTKIYEDFCMAGCENGQLQIFSLESGNLVDNIQAHSMPVTSLVIWNDILVSSSLDKSLKSFNLKKNSTKRVTVEHPIETTTDDSNGVLYAGTSTGKIIRFNMLSVTQIGLMFHVYKSKIMCIKVFRNGFELMVVISSENKPISIRNAETGTLLKTLQVNNILSFDICDKTNLWFGISKEALYTMSLHKNEMKNISKSNLSRICTYGNLIIVCGSEGSLFIYDKELVLQQTLSIELTDDVTAVAIWKHYVVISYRHIKVLKLLDLHQTLNKFELCSKKF